MIMVVVVVTMAAAASGFAFFGGRGFFHAAAAPIPVMIVLRGGVGMVFFAGEFFQEIKHDLFPLEMRFPLWEAACL